MGFLRLALVISLGILGQALDTYNSHNEGHIVHYPIHVPHPSVMSVVRSLPPAEPPIPTWLGIGHLCNYQLSPSESIL